MAAAEVVASYKKLGLLEEAFRNLNPECCEEPNAKSDHRHVERDVMVYPESIAAS